MTTSTTINCTPHEFSQIIIEELKKQNQGIGLPDGHLVPAKDVPDLSAAQAAKYLGISIATLTRLVQRYPEHLKPIAEENKALRFRFEELVNVKKLNLI